MTLSLKRARRRLMYLTVRISKDRDELRALIDEITPLEEACGEAVDLLDTAVDKLSEYA